MKKRFVISIAVAALLIIAGLLLLFVMDSVSAFIGCIAASVVSIIVGIATGEQDTTEGHGATGGGERPQRPGQEPAGMDTGR